MTDKKLDVLVNALTNPNWVDILLLAVTTAYFVATVFVYRANKKMAKAAEEQIETATRMAELSRNVELYDKRVELIEYLTNQSNSDICEDNGFRIKLTILYPDESIQSLFRKLKGCIANTDERESDLNEYIRNSNGLQYDSISLLDDIENALKKTDDMNEVERVKKLAKNYMIEIDLGNTKSKWLDLFEIIEARLLGEQRCEAVKENLISSMMNYIENTISIES